MCNLSAHENPCKCGPFKRIGILREMRSCANFMFNPHSRSVIEILARNTRGIYDNSLGQKYFLVHAAKKLYNLHYLWFIKIGYKIIKSWENEVIMYTILIGVFFLC